MQLVPVAPTAAPRGLEATATSSQVALRPELEPPVDSLRLRLRELLRVRAGADDAPRSEAEWCIIHPIKASINSCGSSIDGCFDWMRALPLG